MKKIKLVLIIVCILLVIPINIYKLKDGGTTEYVGLIYKLSKVHRLSEKSSTGYIDGFEFKIFGLTIYSKLNYHENNIREIELLVKEDTITSSGAVFILKNNTYAEYWYGPEYYIEKKENDIWREIDTIDGNPLVWNTVLYTLKGKEEKEINIDWVLGYGKLSSGSYRLVKSTFKDKLSNEPKKIYVEFSI